MFSTKLWKNQDSNRGIFTNYQRYSVALFATFCFTQNIDASVAALPHPSRAG